MLDVLGIGPRVGVDGQEAGAEFDVLNRVREDRSRQRPEDGGVDSRFDQRLANVFPQRARIKDTDAREGTLLVAVWAQDQQPPHSVEEAMHMPDILLSSGAPTFDGEVGQEESGDRGHARHFSARDEALTEGEADSTR